MVDNDGWIEVKGSDVLLKVIETKEPMKLDTSAIVDSDSDDEGEQKTPPKEEDTQQPKIKLDDSVLLNITARQSNDPSHTSGPICQKASQWIVGVGDLDVLPKSIELGLQKMRQGDVAYIWSKPEYAYGLESCRVWKENKNDQEYTLPSESPVLFEVHAIQIVQDTSRLNPYFPLQKALTRKKIANDIYQNEWNSGGKARERAVRLYEKAGKDMHKLLNGTYFQQVEQDHPQRKETKTLMVDCFNNITAVYMSAKRYAKARDSALEIMDKYDRQNLKAHLRYVKAAVVDKNCDEATVKDAFKRAESVITYRNATEEQELKRLKAQWKRRGQKTS